MILKILIMHNTLTEHYIANLRVLVHVEEWPAVGARTALL